MSPIATDIAYTLLSLALILIAAEFFTNAVEWLGVRLKLAEGAVGSVLAAVGTALPETIIPIVAIVADAQSGRLFTPESEAQRIGMGAIIGAPFMLGTLAFAIVGITYYLSRNNSRRPTEFTASPEVFKHDIEFFLTSFSIGCGAGIVRYYWPAMPQFVDWALGMTLIWMYFVYVIKVTRMGSSDTASHELDQLIISRWFKGLHLDDVGARRRGIAAQLFLSLLVIFWAAHTFVDHLSPLAITLGINPLILALLIVPVATELPEKFNSVLWIRRGKDTLALGNISGALVFQSTFPITLGLFFLDWTFAWTNPALISAILGIAGALLVYIGLLRTGKVQPKLLIAAGSFYLLYLFIIMLHLSGVIHLNVGTPVIGH